MRRGLLVRGLALCRVHECSSGLGGARAAARLMRGDNSRLTGDVSLRIGTAASPPEPRLASPPEPERRRPEMRPSVVPELCRLGLPSGGISREGGRSCSLCCSQIGIAGELDILSDMAAVAAPPANGFRVRPTKHHEHNDPLNSPERSATWDTNTYHESGRRRHAPSPRDSH